MCVFWHPQITLWHHFTNKTASTEKPDEESGSNCFIDSTVKSSTALGFYLVRFLSSIGKLWVFVPSLSGSIKTKTCPDRRRWFFDFDQMIWSESAKGASVQRLTRASHFCFLRQQEKEPHSCRGEGQAEVVGVAATFYCRGIRTSGRSRQNAPCCCLDDDDDVQTCSIWMWLPVPGS